MTLIFVFFYIFSVLVSNTKIEKKNMDMPLAYSCIIIAIFVGLRDPNMWSDSAGYAMVFEGYTSTLANVSLSDTIYGYSEFGFYFLGVIIRTFTDNSTIYFIIISLMTFLFLYYFSKKYCMYPFLGLCVYMGRFLAGRNMVQIRAALAIAIIICATNYITKQKLWKFLFVVLIAYTLHHSAIVVLPVYFMNKINITKKHIYIGLIIAFVIAAFFGGSVKGIVSGSDFINDMASSYVQEGSDKAFSNDLTNPMIYFQCAVLLIFTFYESRLSKLTQHYYTIRNAYFYSTLLLIILCQYAVVAARTSTIFATYEMVMIPMFLNLFDKKDRMIPYIGIGIMSAVFFYYNYKPAVAILINQ